MEEYVSLYGLAVGHVSRLAERVEAEEGDVEHYEAYQVESKGVESRL
jgi:hypothetical protein